MNKNNGTFFNKMAKNWDKNIPTLSYEIVHIHYLEITLIIVVESLIF